MSHGVTSFNPDAQVWALQQWGQVDLGDARLNRRAVTLGARMAAAPAASLPQQMANRAELVATYRLLNNAQVSHAALSQPHWEATRQQASAAPTVLFIQDTTVLNYSPYARSMDGLGPIGDGRGQGLLLHTTLAVLPHPRQVLGIAHQHVYLRRRHPERPRKRRPPTDSESRVWSEAVTACGAPPASQRWVVVTDAGGDVTHLLLTCRDQPVDFLIRVAAERRLVTDAAAPTYLLDEVVGWEAVVGRYLDLPACPGRQARRARCLVSFGQVSVRAPKPHPTLTYWVVRVWEVDAPADVEPIEWRLMSSVSVATPDDALERLAWYTARWVVEDYHQCLKTGCAIERRDLEDAQRIQRLLGFLALVAVRLLQLRDASRLTPEAAATRVVDPLLVHLLAARLRLSAPSLTVRAFFRGVAQLGGFLGRKGDGDPGWQTLWRGWLYLDTLAQGARLATTMLGTTPGS